MTRGHQRGSFLLEALVAILIVALGVLGSVGLLARSMQDMDDARNRGEAAYLANQLIGQMWTTNRLKTNLDTEFASSPGSGTAYNDYLNLVYQRLPNADQYPQDVTIVAGPNPDNLASTVVTITIRWCPPGEWKSGSCRGTNQVHKYDIAAAIGAN